MKKRIHTALSPLAVALLMGASGAALAVDEPHPTESAHSVYHLARELPTTSYAPVGQAGRAGPETLPRTGAEWSAQETPTEARHSVWDIAREHQMMDSSPDMGHRGRAGPDDFSPDRTESRTHQTPTEAQYSVWDIARDAGSDSESQWMDR